MRCPLTTAGVTFCNKLAVSRGPARQVLLPAGTLMGIEPMGMLLLARPQRQSRVHGDSELPGSSAGQVGALACILWNCGASKSRSHCQLNRWGTFGLPQCLGVRGLTWGSVWDTDASSWNMECRTSSCMVCLLPHCRYGLTWGSVWVAGMLLWTCTDEIFGHQRLV